MVDFTELPIPEIAAESIGPAVGQRFPDFVLPDQNGTPVDLHGHRRGRQAMIVFHRSADW